jgi:DNA-binding transcriptional LysR family regulator
VAEIGDNEGVIQAVEAGLGISILSRSVVEESKRCGNLEILDFPIPITRDFYLLTRKSFKLSPVAQDIIALIEDLTHKP